MRPIGNLNTPRFKWAFEEDDEDENCAGDMRPWFFHGGAVPGRPGVDAMRFFYVERKKGLIQVDQLAGFVIKELCRKGKVDDAVRIFDETLEF